MRINRMFLVMAVMVAAASCVETPVVEFDVDLNEIRMGAAGGETKIKVSSPGSWVAMTESPWITVSPANGRGT
ncbi:MAG: BACON domain-containing protein, partial [Bacteroidales bacterium]|nr:BACON domain-containing protein [Bacteroidales bacterium]